MTHRRYPAYRDSGIEWLGDVPEQWHTGPLKYHVKFRSGGTPSKDNLGYWEGSTPWASAKDMKSEVLFDTEDHLSQDAVDSGAASIVPTGSVVVVVRGMILAKMFPVVLTATDMAINQDLKALIAGQSLRSKYLAWFFRGTADQSLQRLDEAGHGTKALRMDAWSSMELTLPPLPEQQAIAEFLDRETSKIDELVVEQERLIELLTEKRQAVISHVVTRGLDPSVPLKDSGVEWLGQIPAHWGAGPLKYHVKFRSGGTPSKENQAFWDGSIPWASAKDMKVDVLLDTEDHLSQEAVDAGAASIIPTGSVVVVVRGMILARTFPVTLIGVEMAINQDLKAVLAGSAVNSNYLAWYLRGTAEQSLQRLDEAGHGTKALRMDAWSSMSLTIPPLPEQQSIAAYLDEQTSKLDALMAEARRGIELLKERRTALISAAVTGKIDVRAVA